VSCAAVSTNLQHSMIFGRVDDASIITGIQQACAELRQCSGSSGGATAVGSPVAGSSSSAHNRSPFTPEQQQQCEAAAAAAAVHKSVSEPVLQQWASDGLQPLGEPSWARLGRQQSSHQSSHQSSQQSSHPRSASRQGSLSACDREQCAAAGSGSSSSNADGGSGSAGVGDAGKSTVSALECDLKNTARLYPPGR
jgi:hypothetical protein